MPFPVDISCVRKAEARLGRELPSAYVASMLGENGGDVKAAGESWFLHPILDDTDRVRFKRTCNDIVHETNEARDWEGFPEAGVSIAHDGAGNHLILMPDPSGTKRLAEAVLRWDHETREVEPVAPSFAALR
jgi:SMI1 / KNR4 family (SUKH-1)